MTQTTVYLVTGANRGIGLKLVEVLAARRGAVVFAAARNPDQAADLKSLAAKYPDTIHLLKMDAGNVEDAISAAREVEAKAGHLDVLIANAGIAQHYGPMVTTPLEEFRQHWEVNIEPATTVGPIVHYQQFLPLLFKSPSKQPQFAVISSICGSIAGYISMGAAAYGSSKAAVNHIVMTAHQENADSGLIASAIHPGWRVLLLSHMLVNTDAGKFAAGIAGMAEVPVSVEDSVSGILSHIDGATRETKSGRFWNFKQETEGMPWQVKEAEMKW
ncbi:hypothetical protein RQP46_002089 [Phenoliferia psychrophenolica]